VTSVFVVRGDRDHPELPVENIAAVSLESATQTYIQIHRISENHIGCLFVYDCEKAQGYYPYLKNV
jgi:hypothetical protein